MPRGDIIEFSSPEVPLPYVQAVVIEETPDHIEVMSTLLVPFQHSGTFQRDRINIAGVVCPASEAIKRETGFDEGELLTCNIGKGRAVAGFDGIVVIQREDGELITGGSSHFSRVPATEGYESSA